MHIVDTIAGETHILTFVSLRSSYTFVLGFVIALVLGFPPHGLVAIFFGFAESVSLHFHIA